MTFTDAQILDAIRFMTAPQKRFEGPTMEAYMPHIQDVFGTKEIRIGPVFLGHTTRRASSRFLPNVTEARVIKIAEANGYKASPGGVWLELVGQ